MFEPHITGSEIVSGRAAWAVELKPLPNLAPRCGDLKVLTKFTFRLWIDQAEYPWARFEEDNVAPVSWGKILVRVPAVGLHVSEERVKVNAKLLLTAGFRLEDYATYSNYRKFQADSRVLDDGK